MTGGERPIRVLVISHSTHSFGAEQRILDTARRLAPDGIHMTLAAPADGDPVRAWRAAGLTALPHEPAERCGLRLPDGSRPGAGALVREVVATTWESRRLARLARSFDIIHSHSLDANVDVALAARISGRRAVLDVHDIVKPGVGRAVLTTASLLADSTIVNSAATRATVELPVRRLRVIHPGVDTDRFRPGPADPAVRYQLAHLPSEPVVGIIGRVDPEKGIAYLVEAVRRVNESGQPVSLAVIGAPTAGDRDWYLRLRDTSDRALGSRVVFTGGRDDIPDVLRALDIMVNASDCEPFGRSVLEAQASGTPVIATRAGGIPDFVADGATGLLVPARDPAALAAAIGRLLREPELARRLRRNGIESATRRFSAAAHAEQVGNLYRSVISAGRPVLKAIRRPDPASVA